MRGTVKVAMGVAIAVALSLTLLLILLTNLFCSLFRRLRERHLHHLPQSRETTPNTDSTEQQPFPPLSFPFYAHGVLRAPTKFLLTIPSLEAAAAKQSLSPPHPQHSSSPDHFVYISNPIYDGASGGCGGDCTPFVTPKSSPSCLEVGEEEGAESNECSPPLKLMTKLPPVLPKASSVVCLVDGRRSLATSTETNKPSSSSSSNSICSSPSW